MSTATITTKGQITIPKKVRDDLHLSTGDIIEIVIVKDGEAVMRPVTKKVSDVFNILKDKVKRTVSVEEMNDVLQKKFREKN
ncbi:TPA: AbrB family transcriptional regulator [Candidatus Delongbacteria bacterium]|nr:MAG: AbrB family transcriptional regulator [Candidatus Delongbacteria bacterium GWF2_40_14]HAQ61853.1 AbrB family transcriptional regulator [Candidatus Delongbacteria bacterium]